MIIGHIGPALAARGRWPRLPLPWLVGATLAPDLLRLALDMRGVSWQLANQYSHLLPWSALLALVAGGAAFLLQRDVMTGLVVGALVLSHVALDMLSGRKQLWLGGPFGLGMEEYQQLELVVETALAWWGWRLARRARTPRWMRSVALLGILVAAQALYLRYTFEARPYATRCFEHPVRPCWIRRRERSPVAAAAEATPVNLISRSAR